MRVEFTDFHGGDVLLGGLPGLWNEIDAVLKAHPLHLKASDQGGIQGSAVFDPKANNAAIEVALNAKGWMKAAIPDELKAFGIGVDYAKNGIVVEAQFSNYPFGLNNVMRTAVMMYEEMHLHAAKVTGLVLITKSKRFPAANSTLYYEQAVSQLTALEKHKIFFAPTRVVGLFEDPGRIEAIWTDYATARYDREPAKQRTVQCEVGPVRGAGGCSLTVL